MSIVVRAVDVGFGNTKYATACGIEKERHDVFMILLNGVFLGGGEF